jgi:hypothetical protein
MNDETVGQELRFSVSHHSSLITHCFFLRQDGPEGPSHLIYCAEGSAAELIRAACGFRFSPESLLL